MGSNESDQVLPSLREHWRGAFVVTPDGLRAIDGAIEEFLRGPNQATPSRSYTIVLPGQEQRREDKLETVTSYRNPRSAPITAIIVSGGDVSRWARVILESEGRINWAAITLSARSESADALSSRCGLLNDKARNLSAWYSPLRRAIDTLGSILARLPLWAIRLVMVLAAFLAVAAILNTAFEIVRAVRWRSQAVQAVSDYSAAAQGGTKLDEEALRRIDALRDTIALSSSWTPWIWMASFIALALLDRAEPGVVPVPAIAVCDRGGQGPA